MGTIVPLSDDDVSVGAVLDAHCAIMRDTRGLQARFDPAIARCGRVRDWIAGGGQVLGVNSLPNISNQNHCFVGDGFALIGDIVLLRGGYDRVDREALVAASAARPEVAG